MNIVNIILMFIILCILASLVYKLFGVKVEKFTFCSPDDCSCVCNRNMYQKYCDSPYLKDGPEALCNCRWDKQNRTCEGTRNQSAKCPM